MNIEQAKQLAIELQQESDAAETGYSYDVVQACNHDTWAVRGDDENGACDLWTSPEVSFPLE